ncbi:hypothetical protein [Streptomyces sp. NPDC001054]
MQHQRVNAAKYISRTVPSHEEALGGEEAHRLLAEAHADIVCPPSGHRVGWIDVYDAVDLYPLPWKARLFLDPSGKALPLPEHLTAEQRARAEAAAQRAEWISREAHRLGADR